MAQRLLILDATFKDIFDSDSPTVWFNRCPFVLTKKKTTTELSFTSVGVPDNSLFSVEERTQLFSKLEQSPTEDGLYTDLPRYIALDQKSQKRTKKRTQKRKITQKRTQKRKKILKKGKCH